VPSKIAQLSVLSKIRSNKPLQLHFELTYAQHPGVVNSLFKREKEAATIAGHESVCDASHFSPRHTSLIQYLISERKETGNQLS
jgi:hypothetical protein